MIEQQIAAVNAAGYRVTNLFQIPGERWQANVAYGTMYYEFGLGATPAEALAAAMDKAKIENNDIFG